MLLIGGYLITDKSNNLVHLRWLPLLRNFAECRAFSWGSAVLAWTYHSLSLAVQPSVTDITGCTPLLMSWIYQRFPQWCPPDRGVYQYTLAARLVGLSQQSRDQHEARVLRWRVSIDWLRFDEFEWRVYDDSALQALYPPWFSEEEEWGTWLSAVPLLCFNIVQFYHVDRVKRHLSGQEVLEDSRLAELPPDVQPTASQPRDDLALPWGVPYRHRRAREGRDDTRRPARRDKGHRERRPGEPDEHGDIAQDREASPPPPPPPPSHGAWHAFGSDRQLHYLFTHDPPMNLEHQSYMLVPVKSE
ncbi:uncharacterized protein DS421_4g125420 [Arachis hypogaea]|nr:uncharacterized protein DS421_4g125420 [Arachis hypogaea]